LSPTMATANGTSPARTEASSTACNFDIVPFHEIAIQFLAQ
jgi:hypothetical protein